MIGRAFRSEWLWGVYPQLGEPARVHEDLDALERLDLTPLDTPDPERAYVFKHIVTQEVAYESRRSRPDRSCTATWATSSSVGTPTRSSSTSTCWPSTTSAATNEPKKREYLRRAGEAAQAAYANSSAIDYFGRLLPLLPDAERVGAAPAVSGRTLDLAGDWQRAEDVERRRPWPSPAQLGDDRARASAAEAALAEVAQQAGTLRRGPRRACTAAARIDSEAHGDDAGVGRVRHLDRHPSAAQQGEYPQAVASYEASLQIRERLDDKAGMAGLLSNLGVVSEYSGDLVAARRYHEQALQLRTLLDDRRAIAVSLTNLGTIAVLEHDYEAARPAFEEAMRLNREVGDAWMVANADNNLGNATRGLGEYETAQRHYAASLQAYREYDDRWALAFLVEDIGQLAALCGDGARAYELVGAADTLRDEIGTPRAPGLEEELERQLEPARRSIGDAAAANARARGRGLALPETFALALGACGAASQ